MKNQAHFPSKVWVVDATRDDNGNGLYYYVWAENETKAVAYLRATELANMPFTVKQITINPLGRYEETVNCKINHPERFENGQYWS